uniref:EIF2A domain-containing protein n=1 Tax=Heterorhabditis bacteriophora TaxID=37862 RepID=A0A1I7X626_HETBA
MGDNLIFAGKYNNYRLHYALFFSIILWGEYRGLTTEATNLFQNNDKIVVPQIGGFALSPGQASYSIACYTAANGIISIDVPNTTQFEWAPDGQHFITATTTPRLRIDNCYRLWHYSGKLVSEFAYDSPKELWQVKFCPMLGYNRLDIRGITTSDCLVC